MAPTLIPGQTVAVIGSPVTADRRDSKAVLSGASYTSSDSTVFTVEPDPNVPNGAVITAVGVGTAILTETATATEPDGTTTESITGTDTITITVAPLGPAASLVFTYGKPVGPAAATGTAGIDAAHS